MNDDIQLNGLVVKAQSGFYTVQTEYGPLVSKVRGRLTKERLNTDPVALGDRVTVSLVEIREDDRIKVGGMIEKVEPRQCAFARQMPSASGRRAEGLPDREQVIMANPDQVVFVFACTAPEPNPRVIDRFLVIAERSEIPIVLVANKVDLVTQQEADAIFGMYQRIGYEVLFTSAKQKIGIDALHARVDGKISAFTGPSGVGKSSLLNALQPGLGLRVREVSQATTKGKHTTVASQMFPLERGGYVADTPGIRSIGLYNIEPYEIDAYFREIGECAQECRFNDCRHLKEPGCAVREAVEAGEVSASRLESYLLIREELETIYYRC